MARRKGLDIKKEILRVLKEHGEMSLRELETKTNSNNITIIQHCQELEYLGHIETVKHEKSPDTGRPYTTVRIVKLERTY